MTAAATPARLLAAALLALSPLAAGMPRAQPVVPAPTVAPAAPSAAPAARTAEGLAARGADGGFAPVSFGADAPMPLRSNNWFALKRPARKGAWEGQVGMDAQGYARFDDPVHAVRVFVGLMRVYHDRYGARSAADILRIYSPSGDCSAAPSLPARARREGGGCRENDAQAPVTAVRAARAAGLGPRDDLDLFAPDGAIRHHDRMRALLDAVATQEIGARHCPQPPKGQAWIGCRVDEALYRRAVERATAG